MAKMAKDKQTDYTRGGKAISDAAIPMYQQGLQQLNDYTSNVQNRIDPYLEYANLGMAAHTSDLMREYQKQMARLTGNQYQATGGGFSSGNQGLYDERQRYYNDLMSRNYGNLLNTAEQMATNEYNILADQLGRYGTAYSLGKDYSDIERYNNLARQNNRFGNQIAGSLGTLGTAVGSIFGPVGAAVGGAIGGMAGKSLGTDVSSALKGIGYGSEAQAQNEFNRNLTSSNLVNQSSLNLANEILKKSGTSLPITLTNLFGGSSNNTNTQQQKQ